MQQGHYTKSCHKSAVNAVKQTAYRLSCPVFKGHLEQRCFKLATKHQIHRQCSDRCTQCTPGPCSSHRKGMVAMVHWASLHLSASMLVGCIPVKHHISHTNWLFAPRRSGRMLVFDRQAFAVLLTGDHLYG